MIERIIKCDVPGCNNEETDNVGAGWSRWGHLTGKRNKETEQELFYLCPKHLDKVFDFLLEED